MKRYSCPQLGACQKATAGEIFERETGGDLKCPECNHLLELHFSESVGGGVNKRGLLIAAGVAASVLVVSGASWMFMHNSDSDDRSARAAVSGAIASTGSTAAAGNPAAIAPPVGQTAQQIADGQAKLGVGDSAGAESASTKAASNEMVKLGIAQMAQNKLDEAEKSFTASVATDPKQSLGYYNMGILRLRQGRTDDAIKQFEASFMAGFSYFDQLDQDRDLDMVKKDPRFAELIKRYRSNDSEAALGMGKK